MKNESAKALAWASGILTLLALVMMSPTGAFALLVLAAISAAIPSLFASKQTRIVSIIMLIISIALAASFYPAFDRERKAYSDRAKERATKQQGILPAKKTAPTK